MATYKLHHLPTGVIFHSRKSLLELAESCNSFCGDSSSRACYTIYSNSRLGSKSCGKNPTNVCGHLCPFWNARYIIPEEFEETEL